MHSTPFKIIVHK